MNASLKKVLQVVTVSLVGFGCAKTADQSSTALDVRFQSKDAVQFVQDGVSVSSAGGVSAFASALSISLSLTINPPATSATGGAQVYASDLRVSGNRVITAYNVPGGVQKGWIDYIDITTLAAPLLISSRYFADADINSVAMNSNGNFALIGAKDQIGSVLYTGSFNLLGFTLNPAETYLSSDAGTGAVYNPTGTNLAITTGTTGGGISILDSMTLSNVSSQSNLTDARGVTYHAATNKYYVVKGQTGEVHSYDVTGAHVGSVSIGGATIAQSKSTIVAGTDFLLATQGDGGFTVICAADLGIAATQAQYTYANYAAAGLPDPTQTVSNAAAFGPGMIFVAAGQAGVRVYNFVKKSGTSPTACQNVDVSYMGYFEFNNSLSVNNLVYQNVLTTALTYTGVLYVAGGGGGFKAVTVTAARNSVSDLIQF